MKARVRALTAIVCVGGVAVACSSAVGTTAGSAHDAGIPDSPVTTVTGTATGSTKATIGPSGGTVTLGMASLDVPPGALTQSVSISIQAESVERDGGGTITLYEFEPQGLTFNVAATVHLPGKGVIHWSQVESGNTIFTELPTTQAGGLATASVTHFSFSYVAPSNGNGAIDFCTTTVLTGPNQGKIYSCPPGYSCNPFNGAGFADCYYDMSGVMCPYDVPGVFGGLPLLCYPLDAGTGGGVDASPSTPLSHFHVNVNGADVTIDCTQLDNAQQAEGSLYRVGGRSASTAESFVAWIPGTAAGLISASALGQYPIVDWGGSPAPYSLMLEVDDAPSPMPATSNDWYSCGAGTCGLPKPDPAHYQQITSIVAQPASASGMATFRISATFVAETLNASDPSKTTTATGDWSLLVTVPATDGGSGAGGEPDAGSSNDSGGTDSGATVSCGAHYPQGCPFGSVCLPCGVLSPWGCYPPGSTCCSTGNVTGNVCGTNDVCLTCGSATAACYASGSSCCGDNACMPGYACYTCPATGAQSCIVASGPPPLCQ